MFVGLGSVTPPPLWLVGRLLRATKGGGDGAPPGLVVLRSPITVKLPGNDRVVVLRSPITVKLPCNDRVVVLRSPIAVKLPGKHWVVVLRSPITVKLPGNDRVTRAPDDTLPVEANPYSCCEQNPRVKTR